MPVRLLINGKPAGEVFADEQGNFHLEYDAAWRNSRTAMPLSLSLPLTQSQHDPSTVAAVLWGFLPDNEHTLQRWSQRFHVSARNPLALLAHVGEDCAGAAQFVRPERLASVQDGADDGITWLDEPQVADRLRRVAQDSSATRSQNDLGQFSLPGAQPKIALLQERGRWAVPSGRTPTTHILKPPGRDWEGFVENEHFCLNLARELGLSVSESKILQFKDQTVISVRRYDREYLNGRWWRVHQEDFCQALGVMPQRKYQRDGGPAPAQMGELLKQYSSEPETDRTSFLLALIFNWLIGGTDAHAKNYSLLLGESGDVRLAPLYDLSSALPYPQLDKRKLTMAMKIGGHYRWYQIRLQDWLKTGASMGFTEQYVRAVLTQTSETIADAGLATLNGMRAQGFDHPVVERLTDAIAQSARQVLRMLAAPSRAD